MSIGTRAIPAPLGKQGTPGSQLRGNARFGWHQSRGRTRRPLNCHPLLFLFVLAKGRGIKRNDAGRYAPRRGV